MKDAQAADSTACADSRPSDGWLPYMEGVRDAAPAPPRSSSTEAGSGVCVCDADVDVDVDPASASGSKRMWGEAQPLPPGMDSAVVVVAAQAEAEEACSCSCSGLAHSTDMDVDMLRAGCDTRMGAASTPTPPLPPGLVLAPGLLLPSPATPDQLMRARRAGLCVWGVEGGMGCMGSTAPRRLRRLQAYMHMYVHACIIIVITAIIMQPGRAHRVCAGCGAQACLLAAAHAHAARCSHLKASATATGPTTGKAVETVVVCCVILSLLCCVLWCGGQVPCSAGAAWHVHAMPHLCNSLRPGISTVMRVPLQSPAQRRRVMCASRGSHVSAAIRPCKCV